MAMGAMVLALCLFALPTIWKAVPVEYPNDTHVFYGILIAMYTAAIPFFIGLYQTMKLLHYIDKNKVFSEMSVRALKRIAYCGVTISVVYASVMPFFYIWTQREDAPGLMVIGMFLTATPLIIAVFTAVLQRLLREAIAIKSENDLTV